MSGRPVMMVDVHPLGWENLSWLVVEPPTYHWLVIYCYDEWLRLMVMMMVNDA